MRESISLTVKFSVNQQLIHEEIRKSSDGCGLEFTLFSGKSDDYEIVCTSRFRAGSCTETAFDDLADILRSEIDMDGMGWDSVALRLRNVADQGGVPREGVTRN
jgi:hypothetical protein